MIGFIQALFPFQKKKKKKDNRKKKKTGTEAVNLPWTILFPERGSKQMNKHPREW